MIPMPGLAGRAPSLERPPQAASASKPPRFAHTHNSKQRSRLDLRAESAWELELAQPAVEALCGLRTLSDLRLENVWVPSEADLSPLASELPGLRALRLVQRSKVRPLLEGERAVAALARLTGLRELELAGRLAGVGDGGLLLLAALTGLSRLEIGWAAWQSQVSQVRTRARAGRAPAASLPRPFQAA
jgi:hypothetical protein